MANQKWLEGIEAAGLNTIGKLYRDAKIRFFYAGPRRAKGSGRQKIYDGKVDWQDLSRFDYVTEQDELHLYTQVLNHVLFDHTLRVVVVLEQRKGQSDDQPMVYSLASAKADYFNERFLHRICSMCGWNWKQRKKIALLPAAQRIRPHSRSKCAHSIGYNSIKKTEGEP